MNSNNCGTPRDRLDPAMLERMMRQTRAIPTLERHEETVSPCEFEPDQTPNGLALAMVYSPEQYWQNLYDEEEGLDRGTIFKELDKPFYGSKCQGGR